MTHRSILKWTTFGFVLQMLFIVLFDYFVGLGNISDTGYGPWVALGESMVESVGLSMSIGPTFGLLCGMMVYSAVVGTVIALVREPRYR